MGTSPIRYQSIWSLYQPALFASGPHAEDLAKGAGTLLGSNVKNFIEAKFDFVDRMLEWSGCGQGLTLVTLPLKLSRV
jgi:hypothetical protein